jgi:xanthine dehydrogenase YagT iron-sulfur-binding subunit
MKEQESKDRKPEEGLTRRGFIKSVGAGAAAAAASGTFAAVAAGAEKEAKAEEMQKLTLKVNGRAHRLLVEPRWSLLFVLREKMGLTGTKVGCERGECGACTVLINNVPRYACMTLAVEAEGEEITTVEGLMEGEELGPVQQAFLEQDAFQCGYCTPGQIVAAEGLLRANPRPTAREIQEGMGGNLCRCGAYAHIFQAVDAAATGRNAAAKSRVSK